MKNHKFHYKGKNQAHMIGTLCHHMLRMLDYNLSKYFLLGTSFKDNQKGSYFCKKARDNSTCRYPRLNRDKICRFMCKP